MPLILLLALGAGAAEVDRYPRHAPVTLPSTGVVRIQVPPELRSPDDPADASDLLLVDGRGEIVPVARLTSSQASEPVLPSRAFEVLPTADPNVWTLEIRDRPVNAVTVRLSSPNATATAVVLRPGPDRSWIPVGEALVWRMSGPEQNTIELDEPQMGTLRLELTGSRGARRIHADIGALRYPAPRVPVDEVTLPVEGWRLQENGWARYELFLPQPWPIEQVVLHPDEPLFERRAGVLSLYEPPGPGEPVHWEPEPHSVTTIRRVQLDGARVDQTTLPRGDHDAHRLAILVDAADRPPLTVPRVTVMMPGVHLVVQDPGPGPHVLYGGGRRRTSPTFDLSAAAPELARMATDVVTPGVVEENPAFVPVEVRAGLVEPGAPISLRRQKWTHAVEGPPGLVRIPLPLEVLAHARADLADLRLVDADDRQIPYILRQRTRDEGAGALTFTRTERAATSILEIPLPVAGVPVSTVTLTTAAPIFSRTVTVARSRGGTLQPLRSVRWIGETRPNRLTLGVQQVVGDTLVIRVDNGDDPPLPIDTVEATWPGWDLWTTLPADGARLVYGDATLRAPAYDLDLLRSEIGGRVVQVATIGPAAPLKPPPPSLGDRLLMLLGVGTLGLALLALLVRLMRAAPAPAADPEPGEA